MTALVHVSEAQATECYPILKSEWAENLEQLKMMLVGDGMTSNILRAAVQKIPEPMQWLLPTETGAMPAQELVGVVVAAERGRRYWPEGGDDETGGSPRCESYDTLTGHGEPGGDCLTCSLQKWAPGQPATPCKQQRLLYVLLQNGPALPILVKIPQTSCRHWDAYVMTMMSFGRRIHHVVTRMTVTGESSKKDKKARYPVYGFQMQAALSEDLRVSFDKLHSLFSATLVPGVPPSPGTSGEQAPRQVQSETVAPAQEIPF